MPLSNQIISQFVKNTKSTNSINKQKETIVYGKLIKKEENLYYVQLDGAPENSAIPVSKFTSQVNEEERVIVMIKNHTAIITGNISDPTPNKDSVNVIVDEKLQELSTISNDTIDQLWVDYEISKWE